MRSSSPAGLSAVVCRALNASADRAASRRAETLFRRRLPHRLHRALALVWASSGLRQLWSVAAAFHCLYPVHGGDHAWRLRGPEVDPLAPAPGIPALPDSLDGLSPLPPPVRPAVAPEVCPHVPSPSPPASARGRSAARAASAPPAPTATPAVAPPGSASSAPSGPAVGAPRPRHRGRTGVSSGGGSSGPSSGAPGRR